MKLILILVFAFSLGIGLLLSAEKTPQREDIDAPTLDDDHSVTYRSASFKRGGGKHTNGRWVKANSSPVCFGAKNNQYGKFNVPLGGNLAAVKLVHLYGYVTCWKGMTTSWSHWGCGICLTENQLNAVITTTANANGILLPPSQFMISASGKWSKIRGYNDISPELVLPVFSHPHSVTSGQELRLWYGEDLMNISEADNDGRVCCDVYALFV